MKLLIFLKRYAYLLRGQRRKIGEMILLFLIISIMDLLGVGLVGPFIGVILNPAGLEKFPLADHLLTAAFGSEQLHRVLLLGIALIVVFSAKAVLAYLVQRRILKFSFDFRAHLVSTMMEAYLRMPYSFYLERSSAANINSIVSHTKTATDDLLLPSLRAASDGMMLVALLAFLAWVNLLAVTLLALTLGSVLLYYIRCIRPAVRKAGEDEAVANEATIRGVGQGMLGIKEIRVLGAEAHFTEEVADAAFLTSKAQTSFYGLLVLPRYVMEAALVTFVVMFSMITVGMSDTGADLFPVLTMMAVAGLRILPAVTQLGTSIASMSYSAFALNELYSDLKQIEAADAARKDEADVSVPKTSARIFQKLEFHEVSYTFPGGNQPAIQDISIAIHRGQSIGLIGESGAGKTTLVDILLGLHCPKSGSLTVDGTNIEEYGWDRWRQHIAYIPQSVFLTDDTLERNIAFGVAEIDPERIHRCIEAAQLTSLLARMPNGVQTMLGDRGIRLSGGERQRIAIARAFYHDRDVLIFDEATSALDSETERQVIEVIEGLHGVKTLIVIAHRMSTVRRCDRIYRLQRGRIIAAGSYEEVVGEQRAA